MQHVLNFKVKQREVFRPFAPSVLKEDAADWFEMQIDSPYMSFVFNVAAGRRIALDNPETPTGLSSLQVPKSTIPSVTHVDYSARVQTVDDKTNPLFAQPLKEFKRRTGSPVVLNTNFNIRGEPIVCSPEYAYRCFMETGGEALAIGGLFLRKEDQPVTAKSNYAPALALD